MRIPPGSDDSSGKSISPLRSSAATLNQPMTSGTASPLGGTNVAKREDHFRILADMMPQIVWTADPVGCSNYFNHRWYAYTGLDRSARSETLIATIHPDDRTGCMAAWT